jgi:3-hydroxyisobutyrate dehydrogenase-like beta-hydroxyacid dehydrogenase
MEGGADVASSPEIAIRASSTTIVCVSNYQASMQIFDSESVASAIEGCVLVQLSSGTAEDARSFDAWVTSKGGELLTGGIAAWPSQIGTDEAFITIAGRTNVFNQQKDMLQALAGTVSHVGEDPGTSTVLTNAAMAYLAGNWIGFCHGALICEREGIRVDEFGQLMESFSTMLSTEARQMGEVIQKDRFDEPKTTVETVANDLALLLRHSQEASINTELPTLLASIFRKAVDAGYHKEGHAAIIKVLRTAVSD